MVDRRLVQTENIATGCQCWNTEGDVQDQYETFNGMPVYYGGDLYDSEDSEWDDPYALASAAYVEDYDFDVPEGMSLMVHHHNWIPDRLDAMQDCQTAANVDDPNMDDFYQRVVFSDDGDFLDSDDGSVTDIDSDMSEGENWIVLDDGSVADLDGDMSVEEDYCDSNLLENVDFADSDVWSVTDFDSYSSDVNEEDSCDSNMGSVADLDMDTYDRRLCLLCPDGTDDLRDLRGGSVDDHRMDHSHTVSWDPGIADSRTPLVCYDCICLMTLFRTVMYLASYWAMRIVWTGPDEGSSRSMAWKERYLPRLYPPWVVDRLHGYTTEIKVPGFLFMIHGDRNNSARQYVCRRCFAGSIFRGKDFAHADWLQCLCGRFGGLF